MDSFILARSLEILVSVILKGILDEDWNYFHAGRWSDLPKVTRDPIATRLQVWAKTGDITRMPEMKFRTAVKFLSDLFQSDDEETLELGHRRIVDLLKNCMWTPSEVDLIAGVNNRAIQRRACVLMAENDRLTDTEDTPFARRVLAGVRVAKFLLNAKVNEQILMPELVNLASFNLLGSAHADVAESAKFAREKMLHHYPNKYDLDRTPFVNLRQHLDAQHTKLGKSNAKSHSMRPATRPSFLRLAVSNP